MAPPSLSAKPKKATVKSQVKYSGHLYEHKFKCFTFVPKLDVKWSPFVSHCSLNN